MLFRSVCPLFHRTVPPAQPVAESVAVCPSQIGFGATLMVGGAGTGLTVMTKSELAGLAQTTAEEPEPPETAHFAE